MRLMVNHFARPGMLVFEGFAGTISCGLAALTCGVNLVAIDNNPETEIYLQGLYNDLNHGLAELESLREGYTDLDESPAALQFVTEEMEHPWPHYVLFCPEEWVQKEVEVIDTEQSSFTQPAQKRLKLTLRLPKETEISDDGDDGGDDDDDGGSVNDSLVDSEISY